MTDTIAGPRADVRAAAAARRAAYTHNGQIEMAPDPGDAPGGAARILPFPTQMKAALIEHNGRMMHRLEGYATVFGKQYDMWDMFGPYKESVNPRAADTTLAANPDVAFLVNHKGVTMARTTNGTLQLRADDHGLHNLAYLNPDRPDVQILMSAVNDGLITEQSFAFMLTRGLWNEAFDEFEIMEFDIDRGDTSAVNYGASPYTSIAARSRELITQDLDHLPTGAARAALQRLQARADLDPGPQIRAAVDAMTSNLTQAMGWFTAIDSIVDEAQEALALALGVANPDPDEGTEQLAADDKELRESPPEVKPPTLALDGRDVDSLDAWLTAANTEKYGTRP